MTQIRQIAPAILSLLLALNSIGCKHPAPPTDVPAEKAVVLATVYPLADVARQIGGNFVDASWVLEGSQSLDAMQPTSELHDRLSRADLILTGGAGEPWAVAGFDNPSKAAHIVRLDIAPDAQFVVGARQLWLDPIVVRQSCDAIAGKLTLRLPAQADLFTKNAKDFSSRIDALMSEFDQRLQAIVGTRVLVLSHDFSALDFRLKLVEISPVNASPLGLTDSDMNAMQHVVESQRPAALLVDINTPLAVQRDLASRLGLPVIGIDAMGSSAGKGHNTYLSMMRYNFEQLTNLGAPSGTTQPLAPSRTN